MPFARQYAENPLSGARRFYRFRNGQWYVGSTLMSKRKRRMLIEPSANVVDPYLENFRMNERAAAAARYDRQTELDAFRQRFQRTRYYSKYSIPFRRYRGR